MRKKELIKHASAAEIDERIIRGESKTDWQQAKAMSQTEVEELANDEEGYLPEGWENTVMIGLPPRKKDVHIRLDTDIIDWFKSHGMGYQTRINAVLRSFVQTRQQMERNGHK